MLSYDEILYFSSVREKAELNSFNIPQSYLELCARKAWMHFASVNIEVNLVNSFFSLVPHIQLTVLSSDNSKIV